MTPWAQDAVWLKLASSGMARDPLTWVIVIVATLMAIVKLASHAYQKIWVARRQTVIDEETREAAHERSQESIILEQYRGERDQALERADQTTTRVIERLEKTIERLEAQLEAKQQVEIDAQSYRLRAEYYERECKRLRRSMGLAEESSEPEIIPPPTPEP